MPVTRASLSCVPKCAIANSLTGTGVRLIAVSPTAMTGAPLAPVTAAVELGHAERHGGGQQAG